MSDRGLSSRISIIAITLLLATHFFLAPSAHADWTSGLAAFKAGQLEAAAQEFAALAEAQPDWYGGHLMLGQTLLRQKKARAAIPHLRRAHQLSQDPSSAMALAQAAAYEKQWPLVEKALSSVDPASLEAKQRVSFYRLKGMSALDQKDWATAIVHFEQAVSLEPADVDLHVLLAAAGQKSGRLEMAIGHYQAARKLEPKNVKVLRDLTAARYSQALSFEGDAKQQACQRSADDGHELLGLPKTETKMRLIIGLLHSCAEQRDLAEQTFVKTADRDPGDWEPLFYLAKAYADWRDWTQAEQALKRLEKHRLEENAKRKTDQVWGRVYEGQQRFELAIEKYSALSATDHLARAQQSLEIQRRNNELERIQKEIEAVNAAQANLEQQEKELAGQGF